MALQPLIFIPGFPGSILRDTWDGDDVIFPPSVGDLAGDKTKLIERLCGPDDPTLDDGVEAGAPIQHQLTILGMDLFKEAGGLYDVLKEIGYTGHEDPLFRPVGWDWRLPVDHVTVQRRLLGAITHLSEATGRKVTVLGHSTGGLVFRDFIRAHPKAASKIEKFIALAVPWAGTIKAVRAIGIGQKAGCPGLNLSSREVRTISASSWAAFDLCPPDPKRAALTNDAGAPLLLAVDENLQPIAPCRRTDWLPNTQAAARAKRADGQSGAREKDFLPAGARRLRIVNILSWGRPTDVRAQFGVAGRTAGLSITRSTQGDGTVPRRSAAWIDGLNVSSFHVPAGVAGFRSMGKHSQVWKSAAVHELLERELDVPSDEPLFFAVLDERDLRRAGGASAAVRVMGTDATGQALPGARATAYWMGTKDRISSCTLDDTGNGSLRVPRTNGGDPARPLDRVSVVVKWDGGESHDLQLVYR